MANPNWVKGVSGNPRGRPRRGHTLTDALRAAGEQTDEQGKPNREGLAARIWAEALRGEQWAARLIFAYLEGLPLPQGVDASNVQIEVTYVESIESLQNRVETTEAAPGATEDHFGVTALQRGVCGETVGQDATGTGSLDPAGANGQTHGVVRSDLSPSE